MRWTRGWERGGGAHAGLAYGAYPPRCLGQLLGRGGVWERLAAARLAEEDGCTALPAAALTGLSLPTCIPPTCTPLARSLQAR